VSPSDKPPVDERSLITGPSEQQQRYVTTPADPIPSSAAPTEPLPASAALSNRPTTPYRNPKARLAGWIEQARAYFLDRDPTFWSALAPMMALSLVLFSRWPGTNFIFDEQEALLANPYVNGSQGLRFRDAIHRDFWGLPPDRSIGSYRPIPDLLWRSLWSISKAPFLHHIYNVLLHSVNGALLAMLVWMWTKRRGTAYLAGFSFVVCAVLTEAVSGIVGIADVLGGMGAICAMLALSLPAWAMPIGVFAAVSFGLFSKESALVCVPLVPVAALFAAPLTHPKRPARLFRSVLAFASAAAAFVVYVELRKRWFQSPLPEELKTELPADAGRLQHLFRDFLVWFHQAPLPKDPLNNPLAEADKAHRLSGALRVYWRGLVQVVFPKTLSGDYSYPQEPVPDVLWGRDTVLGALAFALPPVASLLMWLVALVRERSARILSANAESAATAERGPSSEPGRQHLLWIGFALALPAALEIALELSYLRPRGHAVMLHGIPVLLFTSVICALGLGIAVEGFRLLTPPEDEKEPVPIERAGLILAAVGMVWVVVSYFPHSNVPTVLPTVRAERFWYFPAIGSSLVLAAFWSRLHQAFEAWSTRSGSKKLGYTIPAIVGAFFLFQAVQTYRHATDYRNDLDFWEATKDAVPFSAKAHLNYSVMKGARSDLDTRLSESKIAMELAPRWAMAHVYTADTLCRLHRSDEAWPYYYDGFDLGPNDLSLIALGLQCLYDEGKLKDHDKELRQLAERHEGSWIAYLAIDTLNNYEKNKGVDPKYRPRGYNEGPKE
jgi:hypothetical protein